MSWYHYFALVGLALGMTVSAFHVIRLVRLGKPDDYAPPSGRVAPAVLYSFTGAMSPAKKESASLHLPTYSAGILYHLGTFLSILLFFIFLNGLALPGRVRYLLAFFLLSSVAGGAGILIKRFYKKGLRNLSAPDDYIANLLVTLFQAMTMLSLIWDQFLPFCFVIAGILLVYFPHGKLKHALYFFAARYHLGYFFGWRGVWPPKQR